MKSFRRSMKGISPIFATLILIAIAVIAGIVVYMFTSGTIASLTGGGTAAQEKAAVQSASGSGTTITVLAQNTGGGGIITINGAVVKDLTTGVSTQGTAAGTLPTSGALMSITVTPPAALTPGDSYSVTLTSSKGGSFVSTSFIAG